MTEFLLKTKVGLLRQSGKNSMLKFQLLKSAFNVVYGKTAHFYLKHLIIALYMVSALRLTYFDWDWGVLSMKRRNIFLNKLTQVTAADKLVLVNPFL